MEKIGLIAGNGSFPILFAQAATRKRVEVVAVAIKEETSEELTDFVKKIYWVSVGELGKLFKVFEEENCGF